LPDMINRNFNKLLLNSLCSSGNKTWWHVKHHFFKQLKNQ